MRSKLPVGVNFNVRVLCKWHDRYRSPNTSWNMFIRGQELYLRTPCVKDFCTPVIIEVCSGSREGKFWDRTRAQKNFSYCSLLLHTGTITATVRDSHHYFQWLTPGWTWRLSPTLFRIWPFRLLKIVLW